MGLCPYCKKHVASSKVEYIQLYELDGGSLNGVKYSCPSCSSVLSVGIDPFSQKDDIVNEILAAFGKTKTP
jgi:hypothetical protein